MARAKPTQTAAWSDYDGDPNLYVSNIGRNRLYRNQGNGTFRDVALEMGADGPRYQAGARPHWLGASPLPSPR